MTEFEPDAPGGAKPPAAGPGEPVNHARIDELLAGHALHSLDGDDQHEAERILTEHLPGCERCRNTVEQFRTITADLAFASRPKEPPEMLLPRLRMETLAVPVDALGDAPAKRRGSALGSWLAAAASLVLIGLILWNAFLHVRLGQLTGRQQDITRATTVINQPDARRVTLDSFHKRAPVLMGYREAQVALFGSDIEAPAKGNVYRVWVARDNRAYTRVGDFVPHDGVVALVFTFDARKYDRILITEEPEGHLGPRPAGMRQWVATLRAEHPSGQDAQAT